MGVKYMADGSVVIDVILDDGTVVKGVANLDKKLGGLVGAGRRAATGIKEIAGALGLVAVASKAIDMVTSAIDGAISRYDTLNNFPRVMEQIGFSAEDSEKAINRLSDGIQGLPTTLDDVAGTAQRLAVMTGDLDNAVETTLALNNAFLASGASSADASRGLEQYVQMLSTGAVDLQSWRTLQETMGVALNDVAEAFGYAGKSAQNDLFEALKSGEVTFDEFNDKIIELSNETGGFAERAKTATGGIRTAWTNMKTAVVRGVTEIIESIDRVLADTPLESIENVINNIGSAFFNFLEGIAQKIPVVVGVIGELFSVFREGGIPALFQYLLDTLQNGISSISEIITTNLPTILENGRQIYLSLIQGILEMMPEIMPVVLEIIETIVNTVLENLPKILETGTEILLALIDGIIDMLPMLITTAIQLVDRLVATLTQNLPKIIQSGVRLLVALIEGILNALPQLLETGIRLVVDLAKTILNNLPEIISAGVEILLSLIDGILDTLPELLSTGVSLISELASEMLAAIPGLLGDVGKAIVDGIWAGIKGAGGWLKEKVGGFFTGIIDWGKEKLGINSPSIEMQKQIGRWIPPGISAGIDKNKKTVLDTMKDLADDITNQGQVELGVTSRWRGYKPSFGSFIPTTLATGVVNGVNRSASNGVSKQYINSLVNAVRDLASRPVSVQINGREFVFATVDEMADALQFKENREKRFRG